MASNVTEQVSGVGDPQELRRQLQDSDGGDLRLRRLMVGVSLVGMASMAIVSLYQTGLLKHLPDPPLRRFHSDQVNASDTAYHWGLPDGPVSMTSHAADVALSALGSERRAEEEPWVPLFITGKKAVEALVAGRYLFYQMPVVEKAWCGYCIVDAVAHLATLALSLPESWKALAALQRPRLSSGSQT